MDTYSVASVVWGIADISQACIHREFHEKYFQIEGNRPSKVLGFRERHIYDLAPIPPYEFSEIELDFR